MRNLPSIPLLPDEGFDLHLSGAVDGRRFAGIFRDAWRQLPAGARHCLIARWWYARHGEQRPWLTAVPLFVLAENLTAPWGPSVAALYLDRLHVFAWHGPTMDALDDSLVAAAVAHELAHGVVAEVSQAEMEHEHTIDMLVEQWGFPGHALRALAIKAKAVESEPARL